MAIREVGQEFKVWIAEKWGTFSEKSGADKMIDSIKQAFSTLSTQERLDLDRQWGASVHKVDLEAYFSPDQAIKDEGGLIFDHFMKQLKEKSPEEIIQLLPDPYTTDIENLSAEKKDRLSQLLDLIPPSLDGKLQFKNEQDNVKFMALKQHVQGR